jgi:hypothetical protein
MIKPIILGEGTPLEYSAQPEEPRIVAAVTAAHPAVDRPISVFTTTAPER